MCAIKPSPIGVCSSLMPDKSTVLYYQLNGIPGDLANLGTIRSAVSIYYGDTEGNYPTTLEQLVPRYLRQLPPVVTKSRGIQFGVTYYKSFPKSIREVKNTGKWGYVQAPLGSADQGTVFISSRDNNLYLK